MKTLKEYIRREVRKILIGELLSETSRTIPGVLLSGPRPRYKSWAKDFSEWKGEVHDDVHGTGKILDPDEEILTDKL